VASAVGVLKPQPPSGDPWSVRILTGLSMLMMLVAASAAGVRLLLAARRTHGVPELSIGLATLLPSLAAALDVVALRLAERGELGPAFAVQAGARTGFVVAGTALAIGLARMFRPDAAWARGLVLASALALCASFGVWAAGGQHSRVTGSTPANLAFDLARIAPYAWGALESFGYFDSLRRRLRLGLADPVIAQQFLLWGVSSASMAAIFLVVTAARHSGHEPLEWAPSMLAMTLFGFTSAATIHTAFFPPRFWRRWQAARQARAAHAASA
jgi:hypothetical protein